MTFQKERSLLFTFFLRLSFLFFIVATVTVVSRAQSKTDLLKKKQQLERDIENTNKILTSTEEDKDVTLQELRAVSSQIGSRLKLIENINAQIRNLSYQIADNKHVITRLQTQESKLRKQYAGMIRFAFINESAYNKLMFVFASSSFNQAYKRLKYLEQFSLYRKEQVETITQTQNRIHGKIQVLDKSRNEKDQLLAEQEKQKKQLDKEKAQQARMYAQLSKQTKKLQNQLARQQRDRRRLNNAIQYAIRREIEEARRRAEEEARSQEAASGGAATNPAGKGIIPKNSSSSANLIITPEAARLSNAFTENRGSLPWPVERRGRIIEPFGVHEDPILPKVKINSAGITFETNANASVRAVFGGEVTEVVPLDGLLAVILRHGEYFTVYGNLRSVSVKRGQKVATKQSIGVVATDDEQGPTCQFQVWKGRTPINPSYWLAN